MDFILIYFLAVSKLVSQSFLCVHLLLPSTFIGGSVLSHFYRYPSADKFTIVWPQLCRTDSGSLAATGNTANLYSIFLILILILSLFNLEIFVKNISLIIYNMRKLQFLFKMTKHKHLFDPSRILTTDTVHNNLINDY